MKNDVIRLEMIQGPMAHMIVRPMYDEFFGRSNVGKNDKFILASINDINVGVVRFALENETPLLRSMLVVPDYRGKGIGHEILLEFEKFLKVNSIKDTYCIAYEHLIAFYSLIGFQKIDPEQAPLFLKERFALYSKEESNKLVILKRF